jgi:hypothetical protein
MKESPLGEANYLVSRNKSTSPVKVPPNAIGQLSQPNFGTITGSASVLAVKVYTLPATSVKVRVFPAAIPLQSPPPILTFQIPFGVVPAVVIFHIRPVKSLAI